MKRKKAGNAFGWIEDRPKIAPPTYVWMAVSTVDHKFTKEAPALFAVGENEPVPDDMNDNGWRWVRYKVNTKR